VDPLAPESFCTRLHAESASQKISIQMSTLIALLRLIAMKVKPQNQKRNNQ
jgi:hypothetical protein